jgi:hypothetical protein
VAAKAAGAATAEATARAIKDFFISYSYQVKNIFCPVGFGRTAVVTATPGVLHKRYIYYFFSKNLSREKLDRILPIPYKVEQLTNHFASNYLHTALQGCNNASP